LVDNGILFTEVYKFWIPEGATNREYDTFKNLVKYFSDRQKAILLTDIIVNMIRFQSLSRGINPLIEQQLEKTTAVTNALKSNANIKLALTQLVI